MTKAITWDLKPEFRSQPTMTSTKMLSLSSSLVKMQLTTCRGGVRWHTLRTATHSCVRILKTNKCCQICNFIKIVSSGITSVLRRPGQTENKGFQIFFMLNV